MAIKKRVHGSGTLTVTMAGTPVQFPSIVARSVIITSHESNSVEGGPNKDVAIGASDVIAASGTRKGILLYPTNSVEIAVGNLNELYADATVNTAVIHYFWTR